MAEFCSNCPFRGEAAGELRGLYRITSLTVPNNDGELVEQLIFPIGVLIDEERNISEPFYIPEDDSNNVFLRAERRISTCLNRFDTDNDNRLSLFRRKTCPSLGGLAVKRRWLRKEVKTYVRAQVL